MLLSVFSSVLDGTESSVSVGNFFLCLGVALLIGAFFAGVYAFRSHATKSFLETLGVLPAVVCMVILVVNGNIGAGVAVAGAFSLVRFRSLPGTAMEIVMIFLAMAAGIVVGMGYLLYAAMFAAVLGIVVLLCRFIHFPTKKEARKMLVITIPEDLNYNDLFEDIFATYLSEVKVASVKTAQMGSVFKITYNVLEKDVTQEKKMIDELRVRNGNLEISVSDLVTTETEL